MKKIIKIIICLILIIQIPIIKYSVEEDYEELDYVWLEEEIKNAQKEETLKD